ncbi:hypothetical protein K469DRAFT_739715 [Zopfia rhizophila CBS 207.26]|uniref:Rhodopsin domain-containing protein n=1 Tax=Zopfia rhizophila CBS 207.26 TaxID=1314779 RepID=A0A6A6DXU4_9PEZI|nr:hypothetical protein K469DRAFT_739715 [Zopfia rhizophila CBS 207.26]
MTTPTISPGPDVNSAPKLLGITGALYIIALFVYGARMYARLRPRLNLGWDDYAITLAIGLAVPEWGCIVASVRHGVGRHNLYVQPAQQVSARHWIFAAEMPWVLVIMSIKISIACLLLRIRRSKRWVIFLYIMIAVQIASCLAGFLTQLLQCIPMRAIWDPSTPGAKCVKRHSLYIFVYFNSAIVIITDIIFALLPIFFIRKINRPVREKIVLYILMGMGLFATATSSIKISVVNHYGMTGDELWDVVELYLWSTLEEQIGIIAACLPCLKPLLERALGRLGLLSNKENNRCGGRIVFLQSGDGRVLQLSSFSQSVNGEGGKGADAQSGERMLSPDGEFRNPADGRTIRTTEEV